MNKVSLVSSVCAGMLVMASYGAGADPVAPLTLPNTIKLPDVTPLIPNCADPAADHFITLDLWQRPPPGATQVGVVHAWLTPDGIFHWPFVMRVRNLGDQPFIGKPGKQSAVVTEDDIVAKTKDREVGSAKFDRIEPRGSLLVHFEFTAPRAAIERHDFHRIYTLRLKLDEADAKALEGPYGDCHPANNQYHVEFDGSRSGWIFGG
jgi:hypothetical protein